MFTSIYFANATVYKQREQSREPTCLLIRSGYPALIKKCNKISKNWAFLLKFQSENNQ